MLLGATVGVFGATFGLFAVTGGLSVSKAVAMSLLVFTGASQFAAVGVVASGGSPFAAIGSALLLASRNGVYGLAMSRTLRGRLPLRLLAAQLVIDESTAMATAQADPDAQTQAFWMTGGAVFVFWNLGTLVGALGGGLLGDPSVYGLDAAFPASFLALLGPHLAKVGGKAAAVLGAGIAVVFTPFLPAGLPILCAALAALVGLSTRV